MIFWEGLEGILDEFAREGSHMAVSKDYGWEPIGNVSIKDCNLQVQRGRASRFRATRSTFSRSPSLSFFVTLVKIINIVIK